MITEHKQDILLGNSIEYPEDERDDDVATSIDELGSLYGYWEISILDHIGKSDFKENYNSVIQDIINNVPLKEQIAFCYKILENIYEKYDFEFPQKLDIQTQKSVSDVYDFLKFIEFDQEDFIVSVWSFIDPDLSKTGLLEMCFDNENLIMREVEEQLDTNIYSEMISIFLRTYIKERFIEWFSRATIRYQTEIIISLTKEK